MVKIHNLRHVVRWLLVSANNTEWIVSLIFKTKFSVNQVIINQLIVSALANMIYNTNIVLKLNLKKACD